MATRFGPDRHQRKPLRLKGYDYAQSGAHLVTICTHDRTCLFGGIAHGGMQLNDAGRLARVVWEGIPAHFPHVDLDAFVVMPNHVHGVIVIASDPVGATHASPGPSHESPGTPHGNAGAMHASLLRGPSGAPKRSLGAIVGSYKSAVSKRINELRRTPGAPLWQRNYYEHVIRNDVSLRHIRQYIEDNPMRWSEDPENPARQSTGRGNACVAPDEEGVRWGDVEVGPDGA